MILEKEKRKKNIIIYWSEQPHGFQYCIGDSFISVKSMWSMMSKALFTWKPHDCLNKNHSQNQSKSSRCNRKSIQTKVINTHWPCCFWRKRLFWPPCLGCRWWCLPGWKRAELGPALLHDTGYHCRPGTATCLWWCDGCSPWWAIGTLQYTSLHFLCSPWWYKTKRWRQKKH